MNDRIADFRSDTLTQPCTGMRAAMAQAPVGDDVYGEDPSVNRLEALVANHAGKEAGLFASSGTQSNLLALLSHCERGDEYIVGQEAHTYRYEGGGAAVLGSIQPQPLDFEADGSLDLDRVAAAIKPDDSHYAKTRLLCLENTNNGRVLDLDYQRRARDLCAATGLAMHLDGARAFNAAIKLAVPLADISACYDSVSLCFSKGLGAPVGSVLVGSSAFIRRARRWRKMLGGGMRQAGVLAAACEFALANNVARIQRDHDHAQVLAQALVDILELDCIIEPVHTNMIHIRFASDALAQSWHTHMLARGIVVPASQNMRLVTHRDISDKAIAATIEAAARWAADAASQRGHP